MKRRFNRLDWKYSLAAVLIVAGVWPFFLLAQVLSFSFKSENLLKADTAWDNSPYTSYLQGRPEITVRKITIQPHGSLPWHSHLMPAAGYVVSGEVTLEEKNGLKRHFSAGEAFPETVDTIHRAVAGNEPVVVIGFFPGVKEAPQSPPKP